LGGSRSQGLRRAVIALAAACLLAALLPAPAPANWSEPQAAPLNVSTSQNAFVSGLVLNGGAPLVAWYEFNGTADQIRVKQLVGGGWVAVGGALNFNVADDGRGPTLTSIGGVPYAAWFESNGVNDEVRVASFNGAAWTALGGSPNVDPNKDGDYPSIANVGGVPYVSWYEPNASNVKQVRVKMFNGTTWVEPHAGALNIDPTKDAQLPSLTSVGGVPYVAWQESNGTVTQIRVKDFNGTTWVEPHAGPLNVDPTKNAADAKIASIGGVPYVAWDESDGTHQQIRVARFNGTMWVAVGGSLNVDPTKDAFSPSVRSIGGVPTVAWQESNGTATQIRVARFNGSAWVRVSSSLNADPAKNANSPLIISIGGVPYVVWSETSGFFEARAARLEPDFLAESASPSVTGATLSAQVNDFGVPLPVGFEYGVSPAFGTQTPLQTTPGAGVSTVSQSVAGLATGTAYFFRAFGSDTFRETSLGPMQSFTTLAVPMVVPPLTLGALVLGHLGISPTSFRPESGGGPSIASKKRTTRGAFVSYSDSQAATTTFTVQRPRRGFRSGRRCVARRPLRHPGRLRRCTFYQSVGGFSRPDRAGSNRFHLSGRVNGRALHVGRYRLQAVAKNGDGQRSLAANMSFSIIS